MAMVNDVMRRFMGEPSIGVEESVKLRFTLFEPQSLPQRFDALFVRPAIGTERGLEPAAFVVLVPGVDDDGIGGIEIAISLGPLDRLANVSSEFIGRGGGRVDQRLLLCGRCGIGRGGHP